MKKHQALGFFLALVLLLSFSACGASGTQGQASGGQKQLTLWWWGEGDTPGSGEWLKQTVEGYEAANPEVHITLVEQTTDQLYPAWESAVQAGQGPDIQFLWSGVWALDSVWKDNLACIDDLVPAEETAHWIATEGISYDGKLWLSPWYQISIVWMYNKEIFEEAGLNAASPPQTWEELLVACEAIKQAGYIPLELGGMKDGWGAAWLYSVFGPAAHDSFSEFIEAAAVPGSFTQPEHTLWLERLQELYDKGYVNETTMSLDFFQGRETFLRRESAMGLATNGQAIQWIEDMGGEDVVSLMEIPVMGSGTLAGGLNNQSHSFAIPAFSQNQELAADFLVYTHQPEQLKNWYELTKNIPCDDRFDANWLETPSEKWLYEYLVVNGIPYAEIFIPPMVDEEGMYATTQMIFMGDGVDAAASFMEETAEKWRGIDPDGLENFKDWAEKYTD